ncbi:MAG: hypothetical protein JWP12_3287 [Bacteroidetes bacterium]|nr:hypothetical protein [Bacteroidota bacterium]
MKTIASLFFVIFVAVMNENGKAQTPPVKSKTDSVATYEVFIKQSKEKIKKNEASIDALKEKRDKRLADLKAKYDSQITALESKNKAIRKKVKHVSPSNWQTMQASLNSDMDAFENFLLNNADDGE